MPATPRGPRLVVYTVRVALRPVDGVPDRFVPVAALDTPAGRAAAERAALERAGRWDAAAVLRGDVVAFVCASLTRPFDPAADAALLAVAARRNGREA
jgi:hypothetical protein